MVDKTCPWWNFFPHVTLPPEPRGYTWETRTVTSIPRRPWRQGFGRRRKAGVR